ncbi:MAG: Uma2 family endonuclease [Cyanobacteria bacterium CRU_2_1]|nr:Uma2 family endonuclease [Cyanobacteria bacterium RU_5_0]NJR57969.1 Uma2 family endonuclease [Cyanobacteria bacterium CRU_2_1]
MSLMAKDLEKLQSFCPDYQMELVNGEIIVMSPSGYESDEVAFRFGAKLWTWIDPRQLGRVTGSSAGFTLPNSDVRAPDVSFVLAERLRRSPQSYADLAPDLMVEVKSPNDAIEGLRKKIDDFLAQGTQVGILIHPVKRWVEIRRPGQKPIVLKDGDVLTLPDLLPGWQVAISDLWSPVFDEE